jgi:hypothetical protein
MGAQFNAINVRQNSKLRENRILAAPDSHLAPSTLQLREFPMDYRVPSGRLYAAVDLMRASIEIPADGIWAVQGAEKPSDDQWLLADEDSVSLAGAATLISKPGTGKNDRKGVANADWQSWVRDVQRRR